MSDGKLSLEKSATVGTHDETSSIDVCGRSERFSDKRTCAHPLKGSNPH